MVYNITGGGSGGTGAALTVTAPAGATVTVSKDGKSKTKVADSSGVAVFKGLESGEWTVTITDGGQTASKVVNVTADYATSITFFSATINVTYPAGSTCTATDGVTTIAAPDNSGTWACVVPNAGTWTVSLDSGFIETVNVTASGEVHTIGKWYLYCLGDERTAVTGGWNARAWKYNSKYTAVTTTVIKNANNILAKIDATSTFLNGCVETKNDIDLTGFSKLCVDVDTLNGSKNGGFFSINACNRNATYCEENGVFELSLPMQQSRTVSTVDISSVSGKYDILFSLRVTTVAGADLVNACKIHNFWLEV